MIKYTKRIVVELGSSGFSREEFELEADAFLDRVTEIAYHNFNDFDSFALETLSVENGDD